MAWYTRRCTLSDTFCGHRVFPLGQNHLHNLLLRAPLLATDSVRVDVHGDVAVGVAHENCQLPISRITVHVDLLIGTCPSTALSLTTSAYCKNFLSRRVRRRSQRRLFHLSLHLCHPNLLCLLPSSTRCNLPNISAVTSNHDESCELPFGRRV